jgi:hypothetical protein
MWIDVDNCDLIAGLRCELGAKGYEYPHLLRWLQTSPKAITVISWFGDSTTFKDFLVAEHKEIIDPEQRLLDL